MCRFCTGFVSFHAPNLYQICTIPVPFLPPVPRPVSNGGISFPLWFIGGVRPVKSRDERTAKPAK